MQKGQNFTELIEVWRHIYVSVDWVIINLGNDLAPIRSQGITWINADLLSTLWNKFGWNLDSSGSGNGVWPVGRQAITWTNDQNMIVFIRQNVF